MSEIEVPECIVQWTEALELDALYTPSDQLTILSARLASIKTEYRIGSRSDEDLAELSETLERDLLSWSEANSAAGSVCSFSSVQDPDSPDVWNGTRHEYGTPQASRFWNKWRCLRILLSRIQEAIWRRSWPILAQPSKPVPDRDHYRSIRQRMASDICIACANVFGSDVSAEPPRGSVSHSCLLIMPLSVAGTCVIEHLKEPIVTPGGTRTILVDEPLHTNLFDQTSAQLAWVIDRFDYTNDKVGIKWAGAMSRFLKGESHILYDLARS